MTVPSPTTADGPVARLETLLGAPVDEIAAAVLADGRVLKALRGGLVEHQARAALTATDGVVAVTRSDDGGDYTVRMGDGRRFRVEVQAADAAGYADGTAKVDLRRSVAVAGERLYRPTSFDVVAVAVPAGDGRRWQYRHVATLATRTVDGIVYIDPNCRIGAGWHDTLTAAVEDTAPPGRDQLELFP